MKLATWGVLAFAVTATCACEPTDELQLAAEATAPRTISAVGSDPSTGTVDLRVGLTAPEGAQNLSVRILDASRREWAGVERLDATTLRVPLGRRGVQEILIEATATVDGRSVRTETVVRVPFGVPDPIVDDGTYATFAMEPRR